MESPETDKLRIRIRGIEEQIEAVAEHLTKIPKSVSPTPIFAQMERLEKIKKEAHEELEKIARSGRTAELPAALKDYQSYLGTIRKMLGFADTPELKAMIVKSLVHRVEILPNSFRLHYYVGQDHTNPENLDPTPPDAPVNGVEPVKLEHMKIGTVFL